MARVFISHASADLAVAVDIRTWLRDAGHDVFLDRDLAEGIRVGERWKPRLYRELHSADAIVCVVSEAYRSSEWCAAEVGLADGLGCPLLPVRVDGCVDSPLLDGLQHADLRADADRARLELVCRLEQIDSAGVGAWPAGRSPYPGLRSFEPDMARVFRGRAVETRQLVRRVRALDEWPGERLVVVVGPSGCGKSSLVRAGLVPVAAAEPRWEVAAPFSPGVEPVAELARALAVAGNRLGLHWSIQETARRLAGGSVGRPSRNGSSSSGGLRDVANDLLIAGRRPPRERLLLVVDQGEELLTRATPGQLARFARLVADGLAGPVRMVITLRSEFLDRLRAVPGLADVDLDLFALRPLDHSMLRAVVREPAMAAGLRIEPELVDRLVADTPGGEALPLLAFVLAELARGKARGDEVTTDDYSDLGGVRGALAHQADRALAEALDTTGRGRGAVLDTLRRLATLDETGQPTRRRLPLARLEPVERDAVEPFVRRRLLVVTTEPDGPLIGVAHEALLTAWAPMAEALEARRAALRRQRAIEGAAADWSADAEAPAYLWNADRLGAARADLDLASVDDLADLPDLDPVARRFLAASVARARATQVRAHRRRMTTITTLSILLVLSVLLGAVALHQASREEARADATEQTLTAQDLVARADDARGRDRELALRLGLAAEALSPDTPHARASLLETWSAPHPSALVRTGHMDSIAELAFSGSGAGRLASGSANGMLQIWDVGESAHAGPYLARPASRLDALGLSDDGTTVVAATPDGIFRWKPDEHDGSARILGVTGVRELALSRDDSTLALIAAGGLELWDLSAPSGPVPSPEATPSHAGSARSVGLSLDGNMIAYGTADGTVHVWNREEGRSVAALDGHAGPATVVFSAEPGATTLATGAADGFRTWDYAAPADPLGRMGGSPVDVTSFSADGRTVLVRSAVGDPQLVDVTDPGAPQVVDSGLPPGEDATSAALSPDGHTVAIGRSDSQLQIWETNDPRRLEPLGTIPGEPEDPDGESRLVAFTDDDTLAVTGTRGVASWDVHDRDVPTRIGPPPPGAVAYAGALGFAPARKTFALTVADASGGAGEGGNRQVQLWARSGPVGKPVGGVGTAAALSPDGRVLATDTETGIELWALDRPEDRRELSHLPDKAIYGNAWTLTFSPDGDVLVATDTTDDVPRVSVWDVADPTDPEKLGDAVTMDAGATVIDAAISPDGRILAIASTTGDGDNVALWDIAEPEHPRPVGGRLTSPLGTAVSALAFSADSGTLAIGSIRAVDGSVQLWDVTAPNQPRTLGPALALNAGRVSSIAFSPDGQTLAVASVGRTRLWDLARLEETRHELVRQACEETGSLSEGEWSQFAPGTPFADPCR